jgi:hypothetical protein
MRCRKGKIHRGSDRMQQGEDHDKKKDRETIEQDGMDMMARWRESDGLMARTGQNKWGEFDYQMHPINRPTCCCCCCCCC